MSWNIFDFLDFFDLSSTASPDALARKNKRAEKRRAKRAKRVRDRELRIKQRIDEAYAEQAAKQKARSKHGPGKLDRKFSGNAPDRGEITARMFKTNPNGLNKHNAASWGAGGAGRYSGGSPHFGNKK